MADPATSARIDALEARVAALEGTPTPPPPTPPPSGALTVPSTVDPADSSGALNAWIRSAPDGSTLVFPGGWHGTLTGDGGIDLTGRRGLTLVGTGATLDIATDGTSNRSSALFMQATVDTIVRGLAFDGGNARAGTVDAASGVNERINAAVIRAGCANIRLEGVTWRRLKGFGPLISADGGTAWPTDVVIDGCTVHGGEMGIGIVAGRRISVLRSTIAASCYMAIDLEPDASQPGGGGFADVLIADCIIDGYGWGQNLTSWFLAACPSDTVVGSCVMDRLTVTRNRVITGAVGPRNGSQTGLGGLGVRADKANRKTDFVITDNTTTVADSRPASRATMNLANVAGLVVTGNRQPTAGAVLLSDTGTTGTRVVSGNLA